MRPIRQILHLDGIDQLVQLLFDLLNDLLVPTGDQRHARQGRILGGRYRQRLDVVTARGEQPRHPRQGSRFIFQQY